ncbi:MAG: ABC transporter permease subunit [Streptosporangiales bacterium]|nr:ABC transporter permease subunit [Streptosporangiales bacterium]
MLTRRRWRRDRSSPLVYLGALVVTIAFSFPLYWMFLTSVKHRDEVFADPPLFFTARPTLDPYRRLVESTNFLTYLSNSIVVAFGATLLAVSVSTLAAYSLTRMRFPGSEKVARTLLFAYTLAPIVIVVPLYGLFRDVGLTNSRLGLVLAYASFGVPFSMWLLRSFFQGIPVSYEEAAMVDGATRAQAVRRVVVPLAAPGVIATSMFTLILAWNDFIFAKILIADDGLKTLPVGLADLFNSNIIDWPMIMAAAVLTALPVLVSYLFLQRYLVAGWGAGGVVG